jgi:hypothetical protein
LPRSKRPSPDAPAGPFYGLGSASRRMTVAVVLALASHLAELVDELGGEPDPDAVPIVGLWGQSVCAIRPGGVIEIAIMLCA